MTCLCGADDCHACHPWAGTKRAPAKPARTHHIKLYQLDDSDDWIWYVIEDRTGEIVASCTDEHQSVESCASEAQRAMEKVVERAAAAA